MCSRLPSSPPSSFPPSSFPPSSFPFPSFLFFNLVFSHGFCHLFVFPILFITCTFKLDEEQNEGKRGRLLHKSTKDNKGFYIGVCVWSVSLFDCSCDNPDAKVIYKIYISSQIRLGVCNHAIKLLLTHIMNCVEIPLGLGAMGGGYMAVLKT